MNGRQRRLSVFRHNGFFGSARMMFAQSQAMLRSPTTTDETRELAQQISELSLKLNKSLKTRREEFDNASGS